MVHVSMIASNLATRGDPFVNFNLPSFNVKCSQNLFNLGHPCFSAVLIHKLLTYCFVLRVSAYILFYSCLSFFLDVFFWPAISYQLQKPKHRIWMNMVHVSLIALKFGQSWGEPFVNFKLPSFNVKCSQCSQS